MRKVLIVVDMQNDFVTGSLGTNEAVEIISNIQERIKEYRNNNNDIFFTRDIHGENSYAHTHEGQYLPVLHCIHGTYGAEIISELEYENYEVINKSTFGFYDWIKYIGSPILRDYEIEIVGVCTDICVISNALILRSLYSNSEIIIHSNCCAGSTPEKHKAALEVMKSCHIKVIED